MSSVESSVSCSTVFCQEHTNVAVEFFCKSCQTWLCQECLQNLGETEHPKHNIIFIEDTVNFVKEKITKTQPYLNANIEECSSILKLISSVNIYKARDEINEKFSVLQQLLNEWHSGMLAKWEALFKGYSAAVMPEFMPSVRYLTFSRPLQSGALTILLYSTSACEINIKQ